ncbi:MAG TPA: glycoside hydrolase family 43 protein [Sphingomicrobium sp.]|nr:glycoside hydrolase family 43 protein [Sphingomicrobium sp.]
MRVQIAIAAALSLASCAAPLATTRATFANPVLDADFPDPTVIRASDGFYYAYATQSERDGRMVNIQVARSPDLVSWEYLGDALPTKPSWASQTQDFWAPHVLGQDQRYFMYYSAKPDAALKDDKKGLCLAVATAASPAGPFIDMGRPLQCGEGFVNIDPMVFDDPATGKRLYYWGSGFQPIRVQELGPDNMSFAPGSTPTDLVWPNPEKDQFPVLVEGPWVIKRGDYYYMFYSGDNCCGPKANYAVMVARSRSATGPFERLELANGTPHSIILQKGDHWFAPGHNSIVTDAAGDDWIVYHAVDSRRPRAKASDDVNTRRIMLIDRIVWRDGWPYAAGPTSAPQPAPRIK